MAETKAIIKIHRIIRRSSAILLGLVYFFSGAVKLIDPVGAGFVMTEYFRFLGTEWLLPLAKPMGAGFALAETILGAALIAGVWRKFFSIFATLLTAGFTVLTALLLIKNPVMDCGCFGEAIHLTHAQTFIKNVILCVMCFAAFMPYRDFGPVRKVKYYAFFSVSLLAGAMLAWSWIGLPMIDFTDYRAGAELQATVDAYGSDDWSGAASDLSHPILSIMDSEGEYCDYMAASGKVLITSVYAPQDVKDWNMVRERLIEAEMSGFEPLLIVSGTPQGMKEILSSTMSEWEAEEFLESIYYSDYKTVATINRSNGGATYINDGIIVAKWSEYKYPSFEEMQSVESENAIKTMLKRSSRGRFRFEAIAIYSLIVMLVL